MCTKGLGRESWWHHLHCHVLCGVGGGGHSCLCLHHSKLCHHGLHISPKCHSDVCELILSPIINHCDIMMLISRYSINFTIQSPLFHYPVTKINHSIKKTPYSMCGHLISQISILIFLFEANHQRFLLTTFQGTLQMFGSLGMMVGASTWGRFLPGGTGFCKLWNIHHEYSNWQILTSTGFDALLRAFPSACKFLLHPCWFYHTCGPPPLPLSPPLPPPLTPHLPPPPPSPQHAHLILMYPYFLLFSFFSIFFASIII